jgi:hypothetical protein
MNKVTSSSHHVRCPEICLLRVAPNALASHYFVRQEAGLFNSHASALRISQRLFMGWIESD